MSNKTYQERNRKKRRYLYNPEDIYEEDDDTHDRLTKAYLEYYRLNDKFRKNLSHRTKFRSRKWLREIERLAKLRKEEIRQSHKKANADKKQRKG